MNNNICLVELDGNYMSLNEYLKTYAVTECFELKALINKGDGTMKSMLISLLQKYRADQKTLANYEENYYPEMDQQFKDMMDKVKELK